MSIIVSYDLYVFTSRVENSVDPDQLASLKSQLSQIKGYIGVAASAVFSKALILLLTSLFFFLGGGGGGGGGYVFCGSFVIYIFVYHAFTSLHCCLVVTWCERVDLLALVCDVL